MSAAKGNMSAAGSRAGSNMGSARARSTAGTEQAASSPGKAGSRAGYVLAYMFDYLCVLRLRAIYKISRIFTCICTCGMCVYIGARRAAARAARARGALLGPSRPRALRARPGAAPGIYMHKYYIAGKGVHSEVARDL